MNEIGKDAEIERLESEKVSLMVRLADKCTRLSEVLMQLAESYRLLGEYREGHIKLDQCRIWPNGFDERCTECREVDALKAKESPE